MAISNTILAIIVVVTLVVICLVFASIRFRTQIQKWCDKNCLGKQQQDAALSADVDVASGVKPHAVIATQSPNSSQNNQQQPSNNLQREEESKNEVFGSKPSSFRMTPRNNDGSRRNENNDEDDDDPQNSARMAYKRRSNTSKLPPPASASAATANATPTLMHQINANNITPSNSGSNFSSTGRQTPQSPLASVNGPSLAVAVVAPTAVKLMKQPQQPNPLTFPPEQQTTTTTTLMQPVRATAETDADENVPQQQQHEWIEVKVVDSADARNDES